MYIKYIDHRGPRGPGGVGEGKGRGQGGHQEAHQGILKVPFNGLFLALQHVCTYSNNLVFVQVQRWAKKWSLGCVNLPPRGQREPGGEIHAT